MDQRTEDVAGEHVETEVKLDGDLDLAVPDLDVVRAGRGTVHELVATYLDTPGMDLRRHGITLRRRTGGSDAGWHLKLPREGDSRTEEQAPLSASTSRVPPALRSLVEDVVERRPLLPVVTLRTRRLERPLCGDDQTVRALLADDLVVADPPGAGWREVEVELTEEGDGAFLEQVVDELVGAGWQRSTNPSKYERAVGHLPARGHETPSPGSSAAEVVLAYVHDQIGMIQAREGELREHDPDAVHKTRVATRRLRTTLRVFRRLLHRDQTEQLRSELRWYAGVLGEVRDLDVVRAHLQEEVQHVPEAEREPAWERVEATLGEAHEQARARLDEAMDSQRFTDLVDALAAFGAAPPWRGRAARKAKKVLPDLVDAAVDRVHRRSAEARAAEDPEEYRSLLHETRKKAKAARYAHEALALAWGAPEKEAAKRWEDVTDRLGGTQDAVTTQEWLGRVAADAEARGERTAPFEVLAARAQQEGDEKAGSGEEALRTAGKTG